MQEHIAPEVKKEAFNCPHCGVVAKQFWLALFVPTANDRGGHTHVQSHQVGRCYHCKEITIWTGNQMIYPDRGVAPPPNPDIPENTRKIYEEALSIAGRSPRAAAALLRVCIEEMVNTTTERGNNLNLSIGNLVAANKVEVHIQQALDVVRVIGNDAVHAGMIDQRDDPKSVARLFRLVNLIAYSLFTRPRELAEMVELLPKGAREAISRRDGR